MRYSRSEHSGVSGPKTSRPSTVISPSYKLFTEITGKTPNFAYSSRGSPRSSSVLPPSPREYPIQGLNLIRLLTQNRIADFHTTLESLPSESPHDNPFLKHPVDLERWLMEGSYSKVWSARNEAPAEEYKFFVDSLMGTIRYVQA